MRTNIEQHEPDCECENCNADRTTSSQPNEHKSDCSVYNEPALPNGSCDCQPTELDKAIEATERIKKKYPLSWGAYLGQYFLDQLLLAAKRVQELEKENEELRQFKNGVIENAPACGACAEQLFCGSHMYPHDENCIASQLRTEYKKALEALRTFDLLISELKGAYAGLMMHPSDAPWNGCLISRESKEKLKVIKDIIDRYDVLSTPLAIETLKETKV